MPLYEYECPKCEKVIEVMQKFSDPPLATCETCGGPVAKLVSRTSFQLKGTGWYATDYKKSGSTAPSAPAKSKTSETPSKSGDSSGSKKPSGNE
jgi:putative FmdB family regulatory protein